VVAELLKVLRLVAAVRAVVLDEIVAPVRALLVQEIHPQRHHRKVIMVVLLAVQLTAALVAVVGRVQLAVMVNLMALLRVNAAVTAALERQILFPVLP
jgi:hypothetical protein